MLSSILFPNDEAKETETVYYFVKREATAEVSKHSIHVAKTMRIKSQCFEMDLVSFTLHPVNSTSTDFQWCLSFKSIALYT